MNNKSKSHPKDGRPLADKSNKKEEIGPEVVLLKNQLVRTLADFDNYRKRTEDEKSLWIRFSNQRVLTTLIPILDNFESAQKHLKDSGLAIAIGEFKKVFSDEGLEEIKPELGSDFDHGSHEVVETIEAEGDNKDGKIAELVLTGWKYKDGEGLEGDRQVLRHAKVKVYKKSQVISDK